MKHFLILLSIALLSIATASAQKVSDDKAIEYAKECYMQGMSMEQAAKVLQSKGVSISQMKRLKGEYDSGKLTDKVGDIEVRGPGSSSKTPGSTGTKSSRAQMSRSYNGIDSLSMGDNMMMDPNMLKMYQMMGYLPEEDKVLTKADSLNRIYGHDIFQNKKLNFEPNMLLATPANYIIGPGDELGIMIYGVSEADLTQIVTPEGQIFASGVGPISLKGLTIEQARTKLKKQLSHIYSGLSDGSASLTVTLSYIRSIQVNVMGEVKHPGTYTLPSLATVFHALYTSGGVTEIGTMRAIKVLRNNKVAGTIDIYKFLSTGDSSADIVLQDGDVVLVSPYINIVSVHKGVKRPMRYEMKEGETVADLLQYASGFTNDAFRKALNIMRQDDQGLRSFNAKEPEYVSFKLADGDKVVIGQRFQKSTNQVQVEGAVYNAGMYAIDERIKTVKQLIEAADGLREDAFMDRALLQREMADWSLEMISINLNKLYSGEDEDVQLRPNDQLFIASKMGMREDYTVTIAGPVAIPGQYEFAEGMTIKDLIVRSGGLQESASLVKVDVSRRIKDPKSTTYSPVRTQIFSVSLGEGMQTEDGKDLTLQPFDEVYIRKSPSYNTQNNITINGEVLFAGAYALESTGIRVSDILKKAGGPTTGGFIEGASLQRLMTDVEKKKMEEVLNILSRQASRRDSIDSKTFNQELQYYNVGFNLKAALDKPGSTADIILQPGDIITIPEYNGTVQILGSVLYPNAIAFEQGKRLKNYVKDAGGYSTLARKKKVFVLYMNGTAATGRNAEIIPGCKIVVPMKTRKNAFGLSEILGITSQTVSMASIVASMAAVLSTK